jgi:hypothetical protein
MSAISILDNAEISFSYKEQKVLSGILYFQPIADRRVGGTAVRNLRVFESLCGTDPLKFVFVVTNMWSLLPSQDVGEERELELRANEKFFKALVDGGATFTRHLDTKESAHDIIKMVLNKRIQFPRQPPPPPFKKGKSKKKSKRSKYEGVKSRDAIALQSEMVDDNRRLDQTTAAAQLMRDFDTVIDNLKRKIEKESSHLKGADPAERKDMEIEIKKMKGKVKELEKRKQELLSSGSSGFSAILKWFSGSN